MDGTGGIDVLSSSAIVAMVIAFAVLGIMLHSTRARAILQKWAAANRFELLEIKRPFFSGGFSFFTTSRGQVVYWVRIRDARGKQRAGWVRCGSYLGGVLFSDAAEVKWSNDGAI
jgi:hypothetical protein